MSPILFFGIGQNTDRSGSGKLRSFTEMAEGVSKEREAAGILPGQFAAGKRRYDWNEALF